MKGGRARALLDQLPNHLTRRIAVPLRGYVRGLVTRGQDQAAKPGPSLSRSRMPVIGLVRLQRALRAAMPCSTQSAGPGPFQGRLGCSLNRGYGLMMGDRDTGSVATRRALSDRRDGSESPSQGRPARVEPVPRRWATLRRGKPRRASEGKPGRGGTQARKRLRSSDSSSL